MYHLQCSTLLYSKFIKIIITKDLSQLIIEGDPSPLELAAAWQNILYEFIDITRTEKNGTLYEVWAQMVSTQWLIAFVDACLFALKFKYDEHIAGLLAQRGYDFIQPIEDRQEYLTQIYQVQTDAKFLVIRLNQLNNEYQLLCPPTLQKETRTELDYEKELAIISKFMGQRINKNEITVLEFAAYVNLYNETNKSKEDGRTTV